MAAGASTRQGWIAVGIYQRKHEAGIADVGAHVGKGKLKVAAISAAEGVFLRGPGAAEQWRGADGRRPAGDIRLAQRQCPGGRVVGDQLLRGAQVGRFNGGQAGPGRNAAHDVLTRGLAGGHLREQFWTGTPEQYWMMYEEAARAIKAFNPKLKVGGPGCTQRLREEYVAGFLSYCRKNNVPLDFFTWHSYGGRGEANPYRL
ncbi:MAG: hypothetical protein D4R84_01555, partial [Rhodocyclaceae bacterium]